MTNQPAAHDRRIVVGVDGSPGSRTALHWAIGQAEQTGATVEAIGAWQDPVTGGSVIGWAPMIYTGDSIVALIEKALADTVADVTAQHATTIDVITRVMPGHPAKVLLDAANGAELLVVGSRGHGTFAGILLGSVSQHCVQHAPCPVVVVPSRVHAEKAAS
ncbi:universal stress protein [Dactylosporangium sp. NPDC050688]|uniref:universal stress protein n=1 Tax=Dactylosporangium sp. NPDC050688 TaxID=3157217 RepID=UPI0034067F13